jgi:Fe(3+) dicitrate transport protein
VTRDRDVRRVDAWAGWVQERVALTPCLEVTAGVRFEAYEVERHFTRQAGVDVDIVGTSRHTEWIPGLGLTYQLPGRHTLFAGVHRGFAPPRTSQAVDSTGADVELEAEHSWNYELGLRGTPCQGWSYAATGFFDDFTNVVVPDNVSGGASTADTNAGEAVYYGLELSSSVDLLAAFRGVPCCGDPHPCATRLWLDLAYTFTQTENTTPGGTYEGRDLPYAPEHLASAGLRLSHASGFDFAVHASYTGEQFSDQDNTVAPNAEGTRGLLEDRVLVDFTAGFQAPGSPVRFTGALKNAFDVEYVASRAPEGIFPGAPLHWFFGIEIGF